MDNEAQPTQKNESKLGAFWKKKSAKTGEDYLSGDVLINGERQRVVVFTNKNKEKDTQPDYEMFKSTYSGRSNDATQATAVAPKPVAKPAAKPVKAAPAPQVEPDVDPTSDPF